MVALSLLRRADDGATAADANGWPRRQRRCPVPLLTLLTLVGCDVASAWAQLLPQRCRPASLSVSRDVNDQLMQRRTTDASLLLIALLCSGFSLAFLGL